MFNLSKKPLILKSKSGAVALCLLPGAGLLGAAMTFFQVLFLSDMHYKESSAIPLEMWVTAVIAYKAIMAAFAGFILYICAAFIGQLSKDGYIDAIFQHSEKLRAERDGGKEHV